MTKARKAPIKKAPKREIKWANIVFLAIGILVALSMVITSIVTSNPQPATPPTLSPAVIGTPLP